jgi:hypothetical protein
MKVELLFVVKPGTDLSIIEFALKKQVYLMKESLKSMNI